MLIVTEVFAATQEELPTAFRGWLPALPRPVHRQLRNPFSGKRMFKPDGSPWMVDSTAPEGPWPKDIRCPCLDSFHRTRLTPLCESDLNSLVDVLGLTTEPKFHEVLFAPPDNGRFLSSVPHVLVDALTKVAEPGAVAERWRLRLLEATDRGENADDLANCADCLKSLIELACHAVARRLRVFCYQGPEPHP